MLAYFNYMFNKNAFAEERKLLTSSKHGYDEYPEYILSYWDVKKYHVFIVALEELCNRKAKYKCDVYEFISTPLMKNQILYTCIIN